MKWGMFMSDIGKKIKLRREQLGITQEELAKKLGYTSRTTINKIENGTNEVRQNMVEKFAQALQCSPLYLLGWDDEPENDWYHSDSQESYYLDAETTRIAEQIHHSPELALLFDAAKDVSAEDLKTVHALLLSLKRRERFDD